MQDMADACTAEDSCRWIGLLSCWREMAKSQLGFGTAQRQKHAGHMGLCSPPRSNPSSCPCLSPSTPPVTLPHTAVLGVLSAHSHLQPKFVAFLDLHKHYFTLVPY